MYVGGFSFNVFIILCLVGKEGLNGRGPYFGNAGLGLNYNLIQGQKNLLPRDFAKY